MNEHMEDVLQTGDDRQHSHPTSRDDANSSVARSFLSPSPAATPSPGGPPGQISPVFGQLGGAIGRRGRINFDLQPFEKRSRQPMPAKSGFLCRICGGNKEAGTWFRGYLPVGATSNMDWQQFCCPLTESGAKRSCADIYEQTLEAAAALRRDDEGCEQVAGERAEGALRPGRDLESQPPPACGHASQLSRWFHAGWLQNFELGPEI